MKTDIVVIYALKKSAVIPDCLTKRMCGKTLIQNSIELAKKIVAENNIVILTDSLEITEIAKHNCVKSHLYTSDINKHSAYEIVLQELKNLVLDNNIILINPYAPLLQSDTILEALKIWKKKNDNTIGLVSVKEIKKASFIKKTQKGEHAEVDAFLIFSDQIIPSNLEAFLLNEKESNVVTTYQDWWICEKLKQQKRIVFNVIGSEIIGLGHIYRSLTLAHEITDHEVIFVCPNQHNVAIKKLAQTDYPVFTAPSNQINNLIASLQPNLIVNDILNTSAHFIKHQKKMGAKVINFEDLGKGGKYADLVINELYDTPIFPEKHYLWGHHYLFLRDEFNDANPNKYSKDIKAILIAFGGTDANNLTLIALKSLVSIAKKYSFNIHIICGLGYQYLQELQNFCNNIHDLSIFIYHGIGVVSNVMENIQLAISSNGRTVYELAEMNIPSIVISHHEREATHEFANPQNGFINLGVVRKDIDKNLQSTLKEILANPSYYKLLFANIKKHSFKKNKKKIVKKIMEML